MRIQVLGPLQIQRDDRTLEVGSQSQRRLVSALTIHHGDVVSIEALVDLLWPDDPPTTARTTVQKYMSRLRGAMGNEVLLTRPPGYVLQLPPDAIDVTRFEQLVLDALRGSGRSALDCIDEGLALWHGRPFAEFGDEDWARPTVVRLDELRLVASERRIELLLETGAVAVAVVEAEGLCAHEPLREHPHALWMQGLAREARGTEALRVFDLYRKRIVDEAGMEPSAALVAVEQAVLAAVEPLSPVVRRTGGLPLTCRASSVGRRRLPISRPSCVVSLSDARGGRWCRQDPPGAPSGPTRRCGVRRGWMVRRFGVGLGTDASGRQDCGGIACSRCPDGRPFARPRRVAGLSQSPDRAPFVVSSQNATCIRRCCRP